MKTLILLALVLVVAWVLFRPFTQSELNRYNDKNIHEVFENLSNETNHFGDVCHLQEPGTEVSASEYYKKFKQLILG